MARSAFHFLRFSDCGGKDMTWKEVTAWGLYVIALSVTFAHLIWLLVVHLAILEEFNYEPLNLGYLHAIPTYMPVISFLLGFLILICMQLIKREPTPHSIIWPGVGAGLVAAGITSLLIYPVQVITYLFIDVFLYLQTLPSDVICWCWQEKSLFLLGSSDGFLCDCYIPFHGFVKFPTHNTSLVDRSSLSQIGYETTRDVRLFDVPKENGTWTANGVNYWYTANFKTLILLLQSCIIVTIVRLPIYVFLQQVNFLDIQTKTSHDIHQKADAITSNASTRQGAFQRLVRLHLQQVRLERQIGKVKRLNLHLVIELCYFNFVEGLDAFTLVEDIIHYGDYFKNYYEFTTVVLTFVSITVFIVTTSSIFAVFPEGLNKYGKHTKLFVVILGNLPFLVIRCYLTYLAGGLQNPGMSSIFLMFVVKECLVLLMGVAEFVMEMYADDGEEIQPHASPPGNLTKKRFGAEGGMRNIVRKLTNSTSQNRVTERQINMEKIQVKENTEEPVGIVNEAFKEYF